MSPPRKRNFKNIFLLSTLEHLGQEKCWIPNPDIYTSFHLDSVFSHFASR